jgi:hypothetical protein
MQAVLDRHPPVLKQTNVTASTSQGHQFSCSGNSFDITPKGSRSHIGPHPSTARQITPVTATEQVSYLMYGKKLLFLQTFLMHDCAAVHMQCS